MVSHRPGENPDEIDAEVEAIKIEILKCARDLARFRMRTACGKAVLAQDIKIMLYLVRQAIEVKWRPYGLFGVSADFGSACVVAANMMFAEESEWATRVTDDKRKEREQRRACRERKKMKSGKP